MGGAAIPHVDSATVTRTPAGGSDAASVASGAPSNSTAAIESTRSGSTAYDWDRLERAIGALVRQQETLRNELYALRGELGDRDHRIRRLEAQLLEANQRRQDTGKRIEELISQLDQLDAQLASTDPTA